ncbi:CGNR zinc finger domain-containing protein [Georgenia thermotolerans]|uniref:RNA-binding protein n=1 Tax=Georgenia thermotolerans TaxID=527326 RepID=A0A7J5US48_9MICO|nr:CGNR zinc finger domain-containing protein [Georgenia thermotolerans]KAE8765090.1 RNA-binding protein [Georgenia thermotolerans]
MVFSRDTEVGLVTAAALVNTLGAEEDRLSSLADLDAFVARWEFTGDRRHDDAELQAVRALRPVLRELWTVGAPDAVAAGVNALLAEARALPQLVRHDGWDWHLHATPPDAPLATRMAVEAAMALADVVRGGELGRLRVCAGEDCADLVVDLSRNRSRRYCDSGCGNRANVAAYRARRAAS